MLSNKHLLKEPWAQEAQGAPAVALLWCVVIAFLVSVTLPRRVQAVPTVQPPTKNTGLAVPRRQPVMARSEGVASLTAGRASGRGPTTAVPNAGGGAEKKVTTGPLTQEQKEDVALQDMKEDAFVGMANTIMPLSPHQIRRLRALYNEIQRAAADSAGPPPKPASVSRIVNLSPGATPPVLRLSSGFITSVVFIDSSGQPWPIKAYSVGDPNAFNIQWDKQGNTLLLQSITAYKHGNLAVMLRGLNTPVMVTLTPGQRAVDYRVDMQIPRLGPNAHAVVHTLPGTADTRLLDVLNGIAPPQSRPLKVIGAPGQAWMAGKRLFLRTSLTVVSPSWLSKMSSADGIMHAYMLPRTPIVLAMQHGKMVKITLEGM